MKDQKAIRPFAFYATDVFTLNEDTLEFSWVDTSAVII